MDEKIVKVCEIVVKVCSVATAIAQVVAAAFASKSNETFEQAKLVKEFMEHEEMMK